MTASSSRMRRLGVCLFALAVAAAVVAGTAAPARAQTLEPGWTVGNLGTPAATGTASFGATSISVTSSGAGVNGTSDQFTLVHRRITGNAVVLARLQSLGAGMASQVGVMVRESLQATGRNAFAFGRPNGGLTFSSRVAAGAGTTTVAASTGGAATSTPTGAWVKLERVGDVVTYSQSSDGVAWNESGATVLPALTTSVYVGLGVSSGGVGSASADLASVVVIGSGTLDTGFTARDVGTPLLTGGSWSDADTAILDGAGSGITDTADQFRYVYRSITGAMDLVARLAPLDPNTFGARAGLMIRRGTTGGAVHFSLLASPQFVVGTVGRSSTGGVSTVGTSEAVAGLTWLKLSRRGSTVTALRSSDGITWLEAGRQTMLDATYNVGLVVTSSEPTAQARATFEFVELTTNIAPTVALTAPADGSTGIAPVSFTLQATAADVDGTIAKVDFYAGSTLVGTDTTSPYSVDWNSLFPGSYVLTAAATDDSGATTASATRTVSVVANTAPTVALTSPADGGTFSSPATLTLQAAATDVDGTIAKVDFYAGTTLVGTDTTSPYDISWNNVVPGSYTLTAMATDNRGATTASATRTVSVVANTAPTVALTAPADGSTFSSPATLTLEAAAADVDGTIAKVDFYAGATLVGSDTTSPYSVNWSNVGPGSSYILSAIATDDRGATTTSAPHTVSVITNTAPTVALTSPANGSVAGAPTTLTLRATATDVDGTVTRVDFYAGATLLGTDTTSPYRFNWSNVPIGSYVLSAVATDDRGTTTTSAIRTVSVVPNTAPTVALTAPTDGSTVTVPATLTLQATASDIDGTVARVDFYAGATLVGTDTTSPYAATWNTGATGTYAVTAVARDNSGAATTSTSRTVVVVDNQAPTVTLTAPSNGTVLTQPASVTLTALAADPDGPVASVEFYAGGLLLGTDQTSPYSFVWNSPPVGTHAMTAIARDALGALAVSEASSITIASAGAPTTAIFTPASVHAVVDRYVLNIYPSGSDPSVASPVATVDLGRPPVVNNECRADVRATIAALPPGNYIAAVTAQSTQEGDFRSAPSPVFAR